MVKEKLSKEEINEKKQAEFKLLVKVANDSNASSFARRLAIQELEKIEQKKDSYNKRNNPTKYAQDLRERADRFDKKKPVNKKPVNKKPVNKKPVNKKSVSKRGLNS